MQPISLGRETIAEADAQVIARKVAEAVRARGGNLTEISVLPHPRGIVLRAVIAGFEVFCLCTSFSIINYQTCGEYLMREYHAGVIERFPLDADIIGLHPGADMGEGVPDEQDRYYEPGDTHRLDKRDTIVPKPPTLH